MTNRLSESSSLPVPSSCPPGYEPARVEISFFTLAGELIAIGLPSDATDRGRLDPIICRWPRGRWVSGRSASGERRVQYHSPARLPEDPFGFVVSDLSFQPTRPLPRSAGILGTFDFTLNGRLRVLGVRLMRVEGIQTRIAFPLSRRLAIQPCDEECRKAVELAVLRAMQPQGPRRR